MEMGKNNCCGEKSCENCSKENHMDGCCAWKKCHMIKKLLCIIVIILAFILGTQFGEMKSSIRGGNDYGYRMMNWNN